MTTARHPGHEAPRNGDTIGLEASIVIPTYNKAPYLAQVLEALKEQMSSVIEIIVVDDGSTDETQQVAHQFGVRYVLQTRNGVGLTRARNNGARVGRSDYLIYLDDDIKVSPNYVQKALDAKYKYDKRAVQAGYLWHYTGEGDPDVRTLWGVWEQPGVPTKRFYHVNGNNFSLYKSLYWEAGGNDERLVRYGAEDIVFGYRLSLLPGTSVVYNREMEAFHLPHPKRWGKADELLNWESIKQKYPDLYHEYFVMGIR